MIVNIRSFKQKFEKNKKAFRAFLTRLENKPPKQLYKLMVEADREVWQETDCLSCGNCCKKMTPTFSTADLKRISAHLNMSVSEFKEKWLEYDAKAGDWQNKKQPCQFLDPVTHFCSIYEVRPSDCAGFPHLKKRKPELYMHVHKQNLEYCPATYKMVEKMQVLLKQSTR